MSDPALEDELDAFQRRWEQLIHVPETPRSLLNVIEYSLDSQRKAEVYVNRILQYFLDPDAPHGMGAEFLTAFLEALPGECDFQEDLYDLSDVHVDDQVPIEGGGDEHPDDESPGFVDLVVEVPNEWFLLVEIKFGAGENNLSGPGPSQTEYYYRATRIGGTRTDSYESGHYFLYLHPQDEAPAREAEFGNLTWTAFVDVLEEFLTANAPRYPQRTVFQLRELADDVKEITGMTEYQENQRAKVELYLEHYDAIADVTKTFEEKWESFTDEWGALLGEALQDEGVATFSPVDEDLTAVEFDYGDGNLSSWKFRSSSSDWGMIFKDGWWKHLDELEGEINARPEDRNDVRIGFHHRLGRNRELAIQDRTLKLYFRNMGANDQPFIDEFSRTFDSRQADINRHLPTTAEITGNKRNMIEATYDIDPGENDDFFEAYIAALKSGVNDLIIENGELISVIDDVFYTSINEVYDASISRP